MINKEIEFDIFNYVMHMKRAIKWNKLPEKYNTYLINRFENCKNAKEAFFRIKLNYETLPLCPVCNEKPIKFTGCCKVPFQKTCGHKKCVNEYRRQTNIERNMKLYGTPGHTNVEKVRQTKLKKYGDSYYSNKEKAKQTRLERYGVENTWEIPGVKEKAKQTCLERYGVTNGGCSKQALEKIKQTCLERYGVEYTWQIPGVKEKTKQTCLERYGVENFSNPEKTKQTCLERYGVTNAFKTKEAQEKYKKTCLERYGVDHNWKIQEEHSLTYTPEALKKKKATSLKKWGVEHPSQSEVIKRKKRITIEANKRNKNFMTEEDKIYNKLVAIYPSTIREYGSDKRYPHSCDFYIPDLDLFIEYNAFPTHGYHPYDENNEDDLLYVEKLKHCKFVHYDYQTFTIRDPQKRLDAKNNNLNFIELWTFKEAMFFVESLKELF